MSGDRFGLQVQDRWSDFDGRLRREPVAMTLEALFAAAALAGFSAAMIVPESCFPIFTKKSGRIQSICTFILAGADPSAPTPRAEEPSRPALPTLPEATS